MLNRPPHIRRTGRFIWLLTTSVAKHDIGSLAAVIAFYAFFSLFPLLLLAIYALSVALPQSSTENLVMQLLHPYFPAMDNAQEIISTNLGQLAAGRNVGLISALTLVWSATSGFIALQQALDTIYGAQQQRSFVARRLIGFLMLVSLLLMTLGSAIVLSLSPVIISNPILQHGMQWFAVIHGASRVIFPLSLILGFLISFRYLPSRRIDWVYVFPGALVSAVALDIGRQGFVWYVTHVSRYQMIYGGLTTVMLLVLWMYIGSILVLFGAEVSVTLESVLESDTEKN